MKSIPKVINYCWFGKGEKSKLIVKCIESWKKFCPDYEIVEWNETNYDINKNRYLKEAYKSQKWAFVSDYARLDILYEHGGIYLDTDVELICSIDDIVENCEGFFCLEKDMINTGLGFGVYKQNLIVKELLDSYDNRCFINEDGTYDLTTCVLSNNDVFSKKFDLNSNVIKQNNYFILPKEYFCPYNYITGEMKITQNTHGIHWYGASWMKPSKRFIKKIKRIIKRILGEKIIEKLKKY